jgi:hypothetical protein
LTLSNISSFHVNWLVSDERMERASGWPDVGFVR